MLHTLPNNNGVNDQFSMKGQGIRIVNHLRAIIDGVSWYLNALISLYPAEYSILHILTHVLTMIIFRCTLKRSIYSPFAKLYFNNPQQGRLNISR